MPRLTLVQPAKPKPLSYYRRKFGPRRAQRRLDHPRLHLSPCVEQRIWRWVNQEAIHFNCSSSFVVSVALAHAADIPLGVEDDYRQGVRTGRRK